MTLVAWLAVAWAQDPIAEHKRLGDELVRLAQRNTWSGVDRTYRSLVALELPLSAREHLLGAQAALANGETLLGFWRLRRVRPVAEGEDPAEAEAAATASSMSATIGERYGLVSLYVGDGAIPALFRDEMPFAQQERDAIVVAQKQVIASKAFAGFLPVGTYRLDSHTFTVEPGPEWNVVVVGER